MPVSVCVDVCMCPPWGRGGVQCEGHVTRGLFLSVFQSPPLRGGLSPGTLAVPVFQGHLLHFYPDLDLEPLHSGALGPFGRKC